MPAEINNTENESILRDKEETAVEKIFLFFVNGLPATTVLILLVLFFRRLFCRQSRVTLNVLWVVLSVRLLFPVVIPAALEFVPTLGRIAEKAGWETEGENFVADGKFADTKKEDAAHREETEEKNGAEEDSELGADTAASGAHTEAGDSIMEISAAADVVEGFAGNPPQAQKAEEKSRQGKAAMSIRIASYLWFLGVLLFAAATVMQTVFLRKKQKTAKQLEGNVYSWKERKEACMIGFFKPRIYLPEGLCGVERQMVIRHEQTHIRRRDPQFLFLFYLALILNWYHPLVWLCYFKLQQDLELACDEQALWGADDVTRRLYAQTLVNFAGQRRTEIYPGAAFGKGNLKERILFIGEKHERHGFRTFAVYTALICAAWLAACSGRTADENRADQEKREADDSLSAKRSQEGTGTMDQIGIDPKEDVEANLGKKTEGLSMLDGGLGYRLYYGEPAMGWMEKFLCRAEEGSGESVMQIMDLTEEIRNYPRDVLFVKEKHGYVLTDYHGFDSILWEIDGGEVKAVELPKPAGNYRYMEGILFEKGKEEVILHAVTVGDGADEEKRNHVRYRFDGELDEWSLVKENEEAVGRHEILVYSAPGARRGRFLAGDDLEWLTWIQEPDERAKEMIAQDKIPGDREAWPDGFYLYNEKKEDQIYVIADDCMCEWLDKSNEHTIEESWADTWKSHEDDGQPLFLLTLEDGVVTHILQRYTP